MELGCNYESDTNDRIPVWIWDQTKKTHVSPELRQILGDFIVEHGNLHANNRWQT